MTDSVLIVGRGPSTRGFTEWKRHGDILAVSSGIFAVPEYVRPAAHFVTMDVPKWFLSALHDEDTSHAWQNDGTQPYPFWSDERIVKHVPTSKQRNGYYSVPPVAICEAMPPKAQVSFLREMIKKLHLFGYVPGWSDYSNVRGWPLEPLTAPSFDGGPIGMSSGTEDGTVRNSWLMAVQVAQRLGYKRLSFIGCDFNDENYTVMQILMGGWVVKMRAAGLELVNLSEQSILAKHLPTEV